MRQIKRLPNGRFPKGHKETVGSKNANWKGDKAGYTSIHDWLYLRLGKPNKCSKCGTETAKKYEWANKSGKYKRKISDWIRLCVSCHRKMDGHGFKRIETLRARGWKYPERKRKSNGTFV